MIRITKFARTGKGAVVQGGNTYTAPRGHPSGVNFFDHDWSEIGDAGTAIDTAEATTTKFFPTNVLRTEGGDTFLVFNA